LICDEVDVGFGRTGEWFRRRPLEVVPDILTMAKGLTSAYVALGAVGIRRCIADLFKDKVFYGGLTYNSHPLGCAAALATIAVYEEDKLIERAKTMGVVMREMLDELKAKHPCVGDVRSIGLFGIVELVKDRKTMEPLAPFNGSSPEMQALGSSSARKGSTRSCAGTASSRIRRCASPKRSWPKRSRSSTRALRDRQSDRVKILLFGATGLAGGGVLRACLTSPDVTEVRAIVRRSTGARDSKLREIIHGDYLDYSKIPDAFAGVDACCFCLGVSVRRSRSRRTIAASMSRFRWRRRRRCERRVRPQYFTI
jgi:hypothetical protein